MKKYTNIALLVVLVMLVVLTACTRNVATSPVATPTAGGDVPFPVDNTTPAAVGMDAFATQTAMAQNPFGEATATPQVVVMTETPAEGQAGEQPTAAPQDQTAATQDPNAAAAPTTAATTPLPLPTVARPATYTLQNGEWPLCIARRYGLDIPSFFQLNGLSMASKPGVGTVLKIPTTGTWNDNYGSRTLAKHPVTYTVLAGENINGIACKYGDVTPEQILANNGLTKPTDIKTGMSLKIP